MAEPHRAGMGTGTHGITDAAPMSSAQAFGVLLSGAIESSASAEHALLLLNLSESPRVEACGTIAPGEAETLLPQLAEIVRGTDMLARVANGRYAILMQDCSMTRMTRKIAAIDFLRSGYSDSMHGAIHEPTPIGTTYLRPDDTPERALSRAAAKLDRFR